MFIPTRDVVIDMSPKEFEKYSLAVLNEQIGSLNNCTLDHDKVFRTDDGNYQIDGYLEFEVAGVKYKTLVECKHYKYSITRDKVQLLHDKIRTIRAHKGILISTSNFQSGAIEYASRHGISLIQLTDTGIRYEQRAKNKIINRPRVRWIWESPYTGVLQSMNGAEIRCSYLSKHNLFLRDCIIASIGLDQGTST